jgi:clan AA aspartic protease (TIGR02281 family)
VVGRMTAIAYGAGLFVRYFKWLLFAAVAVFIAKAALAGRSPDWGKWLGSARTYVVSLVNQLHMPSLPAAPRWSKPDSNNRVVAGIDGPNGCLIEGWANGARFDFQADTGAYIVSFSRRDAARLGFNPALLTYNRPYESANGTGYAARVRIKELRIGERVFHDVPADIDYNGLSHPLLAMPILRQFEFHVGAGVCELRW